MVTLMAVMVAIGTWVINETINLLIFKISEPILYILQSVVYFDEITLELSELLFNAILVSFDDVVLFIQLLQLILNLDLNWVVVCGSLFHRKWLRPIILTLTHRMRIRALNSKFFFERAPIFSYDFLAEKTFSCFLNFWLL